MDKVIKLLPKDCVGPGDSSLKEFPLLYLYFDYFHEIDEAERDGHVLVAVYDKAYAVERVLKDEKLFLDLYRAGLLRVKLSDGRELFRSVEKDYWQRATDPSKEDKELATIPDEALKDYIIRLDRTEINPVVNAIKKRYDL